MVFNKADKYFMTLTIIALIGVIGMVFYAYTFYKKAIGEIEIWLSYSEGHIIVQRLDMVDENFKPLVIYEDKIECGSSRATGHRITLKIPKRFFKDKGLRKWQKR